MTAAQAYVLAYDLNGNRTSDTGGGHTEVYSYDALDRLGRTYRDGVLTETRVYDGAGRVVHSGAEGFESQLSRYDANGRLLHQVSTTLRAARPQSSWEFRSLRAFKFLQPRMALS